MKTVQISTKQGPVTVSAHWVGDTLAVHPPVKDGAATVTRGQWVITHKGCGLSAAILYCSKTKAIKLARQWDQRFACIDSTDATAWPYRQAWLETVGVINQPWQTHTPRTEGNESSQQTALLLAAKAGLPIDQSGGSNRIRWRGEFWIAPTDAELDFWTFDSCCETPDGRTVEPDHPESWLRILRLI